MVAPDLSVTVPRNEAVPVCPNAMLPANKHTTAKNEKRRKKPLLFRCINHSFSALNFVVLNLTFLSIGHTLWHQMRSSASYLAARNTREPAEPHRVS